MMMIVEEELPAGAPAARGRPGAGASIEPISAPRKPPGGRRGRPPGACRWRGLPLQEDDQGEEGPPSAQPPRAPNAEAAEPGTKRRTRPGAGSARPPASRPAPAVGPGARTMVAIAAGLRRQLVARASNSISAQRLADRARYRGDQRLEHQPGPARFGAVRGLPLVERDLFLAGFGAAARRGGQQTGDVLLSAREPRSASRGDAPAPLAAGSGPVSAPGDERRGSSSRHRALTCST